VNWIRLRRIEAPADLAVTLETFKADRRIDYTEEDDLLELKLRAAIDAIEGPSGVGIVLITQKWRLSLDAFPHCWPRYITVPLGPVQSIDSITYTDDAGAPQTLAADRYAFDLDASPLRIDPVRSTTWPVIHCRPGAVKIEFTAGFGDTPDDVPADLRAAVLLTAGHWNENREATVSVTGQMIEIPLGAMSILERYRVGRLS
jgi:uncharacterized phiE125 gp8 family phage protein